MKLCPQCAFIYEDDQNVCDMDGKVLVNDSAPAVLEPNASALTRLTVDLSAESEIVPVRAPSSRLQLLIVLIVVLATLLSVVVLAQVRRSRSVPAVQSSQPARSAAPESEPQPSAADRVSSSSVEVTALAEDMESPSGSAGADPASLKSGHLAVSPVSDGAPARRLVMLRLTNGTTIKADEVWETKEGIWYRQGGVITFLNRGQVRAIERVAPSGAPQKTAANVDEGIRKSDDRTAQNQPPTRRPEPIEDKKPSRVKSFLKATGRILKKPFKL